MRDEFPIHWLWVVPDNQAMVFDLRGEQLDLGLVTTPSLILGLTKCG